MFYNRHSARQGCQRRTPVMIGGCYLLRMALGRFGEAADRRLQNLEDIRQIQEVSQHYWRQTVMSVAQDTSCVLHQMFDMLILLAAGRICLPLHRDSPLGCACCSQQASWYLTAVMKSIQCFSVALRHW